MVRVVLLAIGVRDPLEYRIGGPAPGFDAPDSVEAAGESPGRSLARFIEREGSVLSLPAGVDLVIAAFGRRDYTLTVEPRL